MRPFAIIAVLLSSSPAVADSPAKFLAAHVESELTCHGEPSSVAMLSYLKQGGFLTASAGEKFDSATCWTLSKPLSIDGLSLKAVCAADDDPFMIAMFPDFYWRGPGTSDGRMLSIITAAPMLKVQAWAKKHDVDAGLISDDTSLDYLPAYKGTTEIKCDSDRLIKRP